MAVLNVVDKGKKRMKRFLAVLAAVVTLMACAHPPSPLIQRIRQQGELRVGSSGSQPPFSMTTRDGRLIGFEIDLARDIATALGVRLELVPLSFAELLPSLKSGKVDMVLSGMTITAERNLDVAFAGPYFVSGKSLLTRIPTLAESGDTTTINAPRTILTALEGSTSQIFAEHVLPKAKLILSRSYDDAIRLVLDGSVHALVADYPFCVLSLFRYPDAGLAAVMAPLTYEPIGIALPAADPLLLNWLTNFLGMLEGSGEMDYLKQRWFENSAWLELLP